MRVAVSGSSGFIGRHVVASLQAEGFVTSGIDRANGVDLTRWADLAEVPDFDLLVHLAARSFVPDSFDQPRDFYRDNVLCTLHALELCRSRAAPILLTSSYVYGHPEYLPIDERHPVRGVNPYSQSKLLSEQLCEAFWRDFGLPAVVVRPFNVYGPGQGSNFLVPTIVTQAMAGRIVLGDPKPRRDWVHVDDLAAAYVTIVRRGIEGHEIFNLGSGVSHSVAQLVDVVSTLCGPIPVSYTEEERRNEIPDTVADIGRAKSVLDWEPRIPIEAGIKGMLETPA